MLALVWFLLTVHLVFDIVVIDYNGMGTTFFLAAMAGVGLGIKAVREGGSGGWGESAKALTERTVADLRPPPPGPAPGGRRLTYEVYRAPRTPWGSDFEGNKSSLVAAINHLHETSYGRALLEQMEGQQVTALRSYRRGDGTLDGPYPVGQDGHRIGCECGHHHEAEERAALAIQRPTGIVRVCGHEKVDVDLMATGEIVARWCPECQTTEYVGE